MQARIYKLYNLIFKFWRKKRHRLFNEIIAPKEDEILLDLGGHPHSWTSQKQIVKRIDCLNIHKLDDLSKKVDAYKFRTIVGDACNLGFADKSYDIVFSNSVIEHLETWEKQMQFATEARRVGKKLWIQTPAYGCPIEPHFLAPFIHWLPKKRQKIFVKYFSLWGVLAKRSEVEIENFIAEINLLKKKDMQILFPDCQILTEKLLLVFPKSYIVIRDEK